MHGFRKLADVNLLKKMQLIYHNHHFERWILNIETLFTENKKVVESSFIQILIKEESST